MSDHIKIHPKRRHIHEPRHLGDQIADLVTGKLGSWTFIIVQSVILALWIILNSVSWFYHWDAAPFILLNLCLSFQAAFTGPIVLLSQNRQSFKDRVRDNLESDEVQAIYDGHELLLNINKQQLEILRLLKDQGNIEQFIGKIERQEQRQDEMFAKLSVVLEKKPRARPVKQEVRNDD